MELLVTGGYFDATGECFVDRVDLRRGSRERVLSFVPPAPHALPEKGFTGAAWLAADALLVCGFDAVWRFDPAKWRCTGRLHQPDFNDLHGVTVDHAAGQIHVCNTGLDAIETFAIDGRFVGRAAMSPAWFEAARQHGAAVERDEYQRLLVAGWQASTTPALGRATGPYYHQPTDEPFHRRRVRDYAHPNHVVVWAGTVVATSLVNRELRSMQHHRTLARFEAPPHDGVVHDGALWNTTVDGRVWRTIAGCPPALMVDTATTGHLGWCRGLAVDDATIAVGLTAIRSAPHHAWRDDPFASTETSILELDVQTGRLLGRVEYAEAGRHAKVFSLIAPAAPS